MLLTEEPIANANKVHRRTGVTCVECNKGFMVDLYFRLCKEISVSHCVAEQEADLPPKRRRCPRCRNRLRMNAKGGKPIGHAQINLKLLAELVGMTPPKKPASSESAEWDKANPYHAARPDFVSWRAQRGVGGTRKAGRRRRK